MLMFAFVEERQQTKRADIEAALLFDFFDRRLEWSTSHLGPAAGECPPASVNFLAYH